MVTTIHSLNCLSTLLPPEIERTLNLSVFELVESNRPSVSCALPFAEQVRRALIRNRVDTSHSEAITGKTVDGAPLEGHEHAHYLPTDEDGDGRLDHLTIYCPGGFDDADVEAIRNLHTVYRRGNRPDVRLVLVGNAESSVDGWQGRNASLPGAVVTGPNAYELSKPPAIATGSNPGEVMVEIISPALGSGYCPIIGTIFASAKRWRSVTPFSLPRFPNRGGGKPPRPRDLREAQLTQELIARGFPEPISIKRIEGYRCRNRRGQRPETRNQWSEVGDRQLESTGQEKLIPWHEFKTQRLKGTHGKGLAGFEIEFAEAVAGPIALGFGCHFGLGLFMPC